MATTTYTVNQELPEYIVGFEQFSLADKQLITNYELNNLFNSQKDSVQLHILSLSDELLDSYYNYKNYKLLGSAESAGKSGASSITINPVDDTKKYGYEYGGVKLLYHFTKDLYSTDNTTVTHYVESISPDRTELRLQTLELGTDDLVNYTEEVKVKLTTHSYFSEFRLDFGNNDLLIGINIDTVLLNGQKALVVKLYEPLPTVYEEKSTLSIVEIVSDSVIFEIESTTTFDEIEAPTLRSPNFYLDISDHNVVPTGYVNYNDLFSYPINNTNSQIYSLFAEKGIELSTEHSEYSNFIHFSSAEERLLNFKYKLELIENYTAGLLLIQATTSGSQGVTGSISQYENLIIGTIGNFDHYERYLYYESSSTAWPKTNTTKPYENTLSTEAEAISWYLNQHRVAVAYDNLNQNSLINSIPSFLREDRNNDNYLTFVLMIGQHFDILWLYGKAVTDKYDNDNRLDYGISKDLVGEVLRNFGVNLYTSNNSIENLLGSFIGEVYQPGNEIINTYVTGSLIGTNTPVLPSSFDNYNKEVQKRIYHNLPLLLKTKGTERGLRSLINCYGIPADILTIKTYGGVNSSQGPYYGDYRYHTGSLGKIRLDNTGSIVEGSTLSSSTPIVRRDKKYTDDLHTIEVGFSPTQDIDNYIVSSSSITFNIDTYIGDPRDLGTDSYTGLKHYTIQVLENLDRYDIKDYVRLIKFFDNTIFKIVKDFIPGRALVDTGIIIKPHLLQRSKAKSVRVSVTQPEYTGSIDTAFIESSTGSSFGAQNQYSTVYYERVQTPGGIETREDHTHQEAKYDGILSGSKIRLTSSEWNSRNPYKVEIPQPYSYGAVLISEFPLNVCSLSITGIGSPVYLLNRNPRNIPLDFSAIPLTNMLYTSASVDITTGIGTYTFSPNINYISHYITGSKTDIGGCEHIVRYITNYCDIVTATVPVSITTGSVYDLTTWFTTGVNTNNSYTASYGGTVEGIVSPSSYTVLQPAGTSLTITVKDNSILSCAANTTLTVQGIPVLVSGQTWTKTSGLCESNVIPHIYFTGTQAGICIYTLVVTEASTKLRAASYKVTGDLVTAELTISGIGTSQSSGTQNGGELIVPVGTYTATFTYEFQSAEGESYVEVVPQQR